MNKTLKARHEANQQVVIVLDSNGPKFSHIPVMVSAASNFKGLIQDIDQLKVRAETIPSKTAGNKSIARLDLVAITYKIINIIKVFAHLKQKKNLGNLLVHTESDLTNRLQHAQLLDFTKMLVKKVKPLQNELTEYGLTEEMLQELETEIQDFEAVITEPRKLIRERKNANELLEDKLDEANQVLTHQIDPFMELFVNDKEFYLSYKSARMIVDPGSRKREEEVAQEQNI